jgi:hypothetical protein
MAQYTAALKGRGNSARPRACSGRPLRAVGALRHGDAADRGEAHAEAAFEKPQLELPYVQNSLLGWAILHEVRESLPLPCRWAHRPRGAERRGARRGG